MALDPDGGTPARDGDVLVVREGRRDLRAEPSGEMRLSRIVAEQREGKNRDGRHAGLRRHRAGCGRAFRLMESRYVASLGDFDPNRVGNARGQIVAFEGLSKLSRLDAKDWVSLLLIGGGASILATTLFTQAFSYGDFIAPALLQKLQPVFAILLAALLLGERLMRRYWLFFVGAVAGAWESSET